MLNIEVIRQDFPILKQEINNYPLVYLDNAATTQKPNIVINTITDYYSNYNSNVHRGIHTLSQKATEEYEKARDKIQHFINAAKREEIIFTKNDTESLNLIAQSYGGQNLKEDDEIILSSLEHHSNIVPWQMIAKRTGARIRFVKLTNENTFDYSHFELLLNEKTKIVSLSHGSNVTGEVIDFSKIIQKAHNVNAIVIADAGQTVAHYLVDLKSSLKDIDFVTFSSHKLYGPTGVGLLYGKESLLEKMEPVVGGGDMILEVFEEYSTWNELPYKFEAGTPNIADVIGLGAAIDYLSTFQKDDVINYEQSLTLYAYNKLKQLDFIELYRVIEGLSLPIISFNIKGVHSHDVGTILDQRGIAIRTGHHCAQPLMNKLNQVATARLSLALYNTKEDINALIEGLLEVKQIFQLN